MTEGTRFRIFPQAGGGWLEPEIVSVSPPPGTIGPGPSDATLHAILPVDKRRPYDPPAYVPPYRGRCLAPALPGPDGHFSHIPVDDPAFLPAHLYACVRLTLDVWERYLGGPVHWWHVDAQQRLELVAMVDWDNAQSGPGFIETGHRPNHAGIEHLFCLNFDVVAHETGHTLLFSELGAPTPQEMTPQFLAFHESFSDLVALVSALHIPSIAERLLGQTAGNLYTLNLLNRVGELSDSEQIRIADNTAVMADVAGLRPGWDGEWVDPLGMGRNAHHLAQPLTGAMFDLLVEVFQAGLVARGALPPRLDARAWTRAEAETALVRTQVGSAASLAAFRRTFHDALRQARDVLGRCMAHVMQTLRPDEVTFDAVAAAVVQSAARQGCGPQLPSIVEIFLLRGIDPRPALADRRRSAQAWRFLPYAERVRRVAHARHGAHGCACRTGSLLLANRLVRHPQRTQHAAPSG